MKMKYLLLGIGALLAAGGLWAGRMAWRVHHQLVTLDVREVPLAEVLRLVERQTWTKLRAEGALDARITLHLKDKPLAYALKQIGDQAGARWSTLYAVYASTRALGALDAALRQDGKFETAGWKKMAPRPRPMAAPELEESGAGFQPNPNPGDPGPESGQGQIMRFKRTPNGTVVIAGANSQTETWSAAILVFEASLSGQLIGGPDLAATPEAAADLARKVNGHWTTYLALTPLPAGLRFGSGGGFGGGFHGPPPPGVDPFKLIQNGKLGPNDRFARLTPEQRVQRARELRERRERLGR
jgi:hypothetical protein